jgi:hypothetical protein
MPPEETVADFALEIGRQYLVRTEFCDVELVLKRKPPGVEILSRLLPRRKASS